MINSLHMILTKILEFEKKKKLNMKFANILQRKKIQIEIQCEIYNNVITM